MAFSDKELASISLEMVAGIARLGPQKRQDPRAQLASVFDLGFFPRTIKREELLLPADVVVNRLHEIATS